MKHPLEERLRQLEAKAAQRAERDQVAQLDLTQPHDCYTLRIYRTAANSRRPITLAQASAKATQVEQFLAAIVALENGETDQDCQHA